MDNSGDKDMQNNSVETRINDKFLQELFPPDKADRFFEALYGGAEAGAFDISMRFTGFNAERKVFHLEFLLTERPGKCMACSLTYGLPEVFKRHPVIDIVGITQKIEEELHPAWRVRGWSLGSTRTISPTENSIPLNLELEMK